MTTGFPCGGRENKIKFLLHTIPKNKSWMDQFYKCGKQNFKTLREKTQEAIFVASRVESCL